MQPVSILLAEAHYLVRLGLRCLISQQKSLHIISEATDREELESQLAIHQPDIVILDHKAEDFGLPTVSIIKELSPKSNILVISSEDDKNAIYQVLEEGVQSFLTKSCGEEEEIVDAIRATARGEKFFCTRVIDYLLEKSFAKEEDICAPTPLTPREVEIVQLTAKGLIAKEIASQLNLSTHTVYTHRKNIMKKLKLNTSSELVLYAVNNGIVKNKQ